MRSHRSLLLALLPLLIAVIVAGAQAQTPAPAKAPDVPFVPSDEKVVDEMLKMASVKKGDVLYDLGSGDGRIVITAARRFGTRGVGIDIDPELVQKARANAAAAGVSDRVKFIEGDLFEADIREATVVTMYLLPEVNLKLRPKLLSDLKPGTRIVSHNYDLGDWKPEKTSKVTILGTDHHVYYWVVPRKSAGRK